MNLTTQVGAALAETFPAAAARRSRAKLELHSTPKHGGWRNVADIELSVLTTRRLGRRRPDRDQLAAAGAAWAARRHVRHATSDWQCRTQDAHLKLRHLYPAL